VCACNSETQGLYVFNDMLTGLIRDASTIVRAGREALA
jgi:hypothetical protein